MHLFGESTDILISVSHDLPVRPRVSLRSWKTSNGKGMEEAQTEGGVIILLVFEIISHVLFFM